MMPRLRRHCSTAQARAARHFLALCLLLVSSVGSGQAEQPPALALDPVGYAPAESCIGCHTGQAQTWEGSDHQRAMARASPDSVLGDFADVRFDKAGVQARFFRKGDGYFVNTEGADGKPADFQVLYSFGHYPLQQYLVAFPGGRLQALTIAWDSRPKQAGGQRWFSLYPGQHFAPSDPLHWTGRYQNWNAMCADCHSTNLQKHYDDKTDSFASTWHEQNVGCQACHGPGQAHVDWARQAPPGQSPASSRDMGLAVDFKALGSRGLVEQCAYCHSRRQGLGNGQQPGQGLLASALPASLRADLYHADGQIDGEVYEYASFAQSRMYAAGVGCTDCHDPHSTRVKVEGNGLCLQCHNPTPPARFPGLRVKDYDSPAHHHHQTSSAGAQCVGCHMPSKTYMVVDPRRDHSLRIPRPDLADKTASPDACTACHRDKEPQWAARAIEGWFGQPQRPRHYGEAFNAARSQGAEALPLLRKVLEDMGQPAVVRASAAAQLLPFGPPALPSLSQALDDPSALVRAYAASAFAEELPVRRVERLLPLLDDPDLAVRDEALRALAGIPSTALPEPRRAAFKAQLADYERRLRGNADLPGNRLNLAVFLEREGRQLEALEEYRQALRMDPYFSPARVNLATLANSLLRQDEAERTLRDGLALADQPATDHGNLAYMLALLLVEHGRAEEGLPWLEQAAMVMPGDSRIRYNQGLLLLRLARPDEARAALEAGLAQSPADGDLLYALAYLHAIAGRRDQAREYLRQLEHSAPGDTRLAGMKQELDRP
ncbi:tetratricopeptide repeat protein [Pseudomonas boanensis]|uniref:tetratricopeptide repeat protein n=1 Tax=Metapseudomonas boanensis TaxID=2822138 RepID=UPI0035D44DC6